MFPRFFSVPAGVYLCCVLENHNETPLGKRTHLLCTSILWESTDSRHWHFTCMKTNVGTYYHINTPATQANYMGQTLEGFFRSPHFNTCFQFPKRNRCGWQMQTARTRARLVVFNQNQRDHMGSYCQGKAINSRKYPALITL